MSLSNFRIIFLYEFKLNRSVAETARKINQALGNDSVNERPIRRWFAKCRSGDFNFEDELRSGWTTVIQDEDLRTLVETDQSQTVRGMAEGLGVNSHAVFDFHWKPQKFVNDRHRSTIWTIDRNCHVSRSVLLCFCATKTILFRIGSSRVMKSGSSTTIGDVRDSGWTPMSHPGTSQRWKPTKEVHGYCMLVSSWCGSL